MGSRLAGQMAEEYILDEQVYNEQDLQNYLLMMTSMLHLLDQTQHSVQKL